MNIYLMLCFDSTMPLYRIHRMKDTPRQAFRWAAHTAGAASVKPKDYEAAGEIEAASAYGAWSQMLESGGRLEVGDLLEDTQGGLRICKYVGFEEAHWLTPEGKTGLVTARMAVTAPARRDEPA